VIARVYQSPGPVAAAFLQSAGAFDVCMGPIGSGKTSTAMMKCKQVLRWMPPSPQDGFRRAKIVIVRNHYTDLVSTTIPSFHEWFPPSDANWRKSDLIFTQTYNFNPDGVPDYGTLIVEFLALDQKGIENKLRGLQVTGFAVEECDLIDPDIVPMLITRCKRFPSKNNGGMDRAFGWGTCNAPSVDNWVYRDLVEAPVPGWRLFRQPGGLEDGAENLDNLNGGRAYYEGLRSQLPKQLFRRMVENRWGHSTNGQPVHPLFDDEVHVSDDLLEMWPDEDLLIGIDGGRTPAAAFFQMRGNGKIQVLDEVVTRNCGPVQFGKLLLDISARRFKGRKARGWVDPAMNQGGMDDRWDPSDMLALRNVTGWQIRAAPGQNNVSLRRDALDALLTDDQRGNFIISRRGCPTLVRGLASKFKFRWVMKPGGKELNVLPDKCFESHVCEALEYGLLGISDLSALRARSMVLRGLKRRSSIVQGAVRIS
jgi:hypothetical protein